MLDEASVGEGLRGGGEDRGPDAEVSGGLNGLDDVIRGKIERDDEAVLVDGEGLALEGVFDEVAAGESSGVCGAGITAEVDGGTPAGGEVGVELGGWADADEGESIAIGGFWPGGAVVVGEALDNNAGGVYEGDSFSAVIEAAFVFCGGDDELCAGCEGGAEGEGVGEAVGEGEVAEVDLSSGDVGEFDEFVFFGRSWFVVVEFRGDEVGGVGGCAVGDVGRLEGGPDSVFEDAGVVSGAGGEGDGAGVGDGGGVTRVGAISGVEDGAAGVGVGHDEGGGVALGVDWGVDLWVEVPAAELI